MKTLVVLFFVFIIKSDKCDEYKLYEEIVDAAKHAENYVIPLNNSEFLDGVDNSKIDDAGVFDFIIVGAGTTGAVLANRLSEVRQWKILVLEAGEHDTNVTTIPGCSNFFLNAKHMWNYKTVPQKYGCRDLPNNQCDYPSGKIIGGSSSINGMIYARGNKNDFDHWANLTNNKWNYENILPYFKKMEQLNFIERDGKYHGYSGPLSINYTEPYLKFQKMFENSFHELGEKTLDYNGLQQIGVSRTQMFSKYGKRVSSANSYLLPVVDRDNLNLRIKSFVTKLVVNSTSKVIEGVLYTRNKTMFKARARYEVILSAGAVNSPQILMLSGIGPKQELQKHNISLIKNLPVGTKLFDHAVYALQFSTNLTQTSKKPLEILKEYLQGTGPLTSPSNVKSLGFKGNKKQTLSEYVLIPPLSKINIPGVLQVAPDNNFLLVVIYLHPKSIGSVKLKSNNINDFPLINSSFLTNKEDIEQLFEAIQYGISLFESSCFKKINVTLNSTVTDCLDYDLYSKEYWYCAIKHSAIPAYHGMGTTNMGNSENNSVVDPDLKVHGVKGLRVADCGVVPRAISGHPSSVAFMIGEKLSDMIKKEYKV